jgi:hypothetical protein
MLNLIDLQTFWVTTTNVLLGLATLGCVALIGSVVVNELIERWVDRLVGQPEGDKHTIRVRGLGLTMADGGTRAEDEEKASGPDFWGF